MPLVSIIVPIYKVEPYLRECLDSVLRQTFQDFEMVLVDDGSPDKCPSICDEYADKDNRIIVIHKQNGGPSPSSARNAGIEYVFANSNCKYISFIDSDDYVESNFIEKMLDAIKGCDVSICYYARWNDNSQLFSRSQKYLYTNSTGYWYVPSNGGIEDSVCAKLFKKELYFDIFFPRGQLFEDGFTIYKVISKCTKVAVVPQILYHYRVRPGSTMTSTNIKSIENRMDDLHLYIDMAFYFFKEKDYVLAVRNYTTALRITSHLFPKYPYRIRSNYLLLKRMHFLLEEKEIRHSSFGEKIFFHFPFIYSSLRNIWSVFEKDD